MWVMGRGNSNAKDDERKRSSRGKRKNERKNEL